MANLIITPSSSSLMIILGYTALLLLSRASMGIRAESEDKQLKPFKRSKLEYYVQAHVGPGSAASSDRFLPALNATATAKFGGGNLFAFNITKGADPASAQLGFVRGYTVETSYLASRSSAVETATIEYEDAKYKGTFTVVGILGAAGPNELAIVGGTESFRGAQGWLTINLANTTGFSLFTFHHEAHFL